MARSTIIFQDARSLGVVSQSCRRLISNRFFFTWSSHRGRCAPLRLMPNWGSLSNTLFGGHESGILMTFPSHRIMPLSGCSVYRIDQHARGSSFFSTLYARTHLRCRSADVIRETKKLEKPCQDGRLTHQSLISSGRAYCRNEESHHTTHFFYLA